ncbi:MAG: sulfite exporter TauE/SafE family protein [Candidatus Diapherotrites archaeon]|uniref:Probable membrane transporter protein n=1 Tax=Candidatus Iainarchaeum sp. TaxID=3101447 RepID=A0A938YXQ0_9ARCH|nr:sulfite exporter TauE/SafE family protein [Candidatus Diapherotrites archaeon]
MDLIQLGIFAAIGAFTGFISGMFGIGGGSIRIPLLAMTGMALIPAFATNMFAIPFSSGIGAYIQRKNIGWDITKPFVTGALVGIVIATLIVGFVSSQFLAIVFLLSTILTIFGLYLNKISNEIYNKIRPTWFNLFFAGFIANFIIGMRGGSGGTAFPPLLRAMHIKIHSAIATSLFAGVFTSLAALGIYFTRGDIIIFPAAIVAITGVGGSYIGSKLSMRTESKWLKLGLALLIFIFACIIIYKEFF